MKNTRWQNSVPSPRRLVAVRCYTGTVYDVCGVWNGFELMMRLLRDATKNLHYRNNKL